MRQHELRAILDHHLPRRNLFGITRLAEVLITLVKQAPNREFLHAITQGYILLNINR